MSRAVMAGALLARLRARAAGLAARAVARVRRDEARFGRRDRLAEAQQLWPGED